MPWRERGAPVEVQAAWLHHRFTQIHPFADGNGRVARALASLVFIKARWFPLIVKRDDWSRYRIQEREQPEWEYEEDAGAAAVHTYIARESSGTRCAEFKDVREVAARDRIQVRFNATLASLSPDIPQIAPSELTTGEVGTDRASVHLYWKDGTPAILMTRFRRLRFGTEEQNRASQKRQARADGMANFLPGDVRETEECQNEESKFLADLDAWKNDHMESSRPRFSAALSRCWPGLRYGMNGPLNGISR